MSIAKTLDLSIKLSEIGLENKEKCYHLAGRKYDNYMDNETWSRFIDEMKNEYQSAYAEYSKGSGDELGIKKVGKFPPKMASFGSSSRMIYLLSRKVPEFCFEKKLPTTVGGIANMDGFLQGEGKQFYIEAKCREPYSPKTYIVDRKYEELYRYIDQDKSVDFNCEINILDSKKMQVQFKAKVTEITAFDIKQMICHLLGIATQKLNQPTKDKINFLYLLYNPSHIKIVNPKHEEKIMDAYKTQVKECNSIPFTDLFNVILNYLYNKRVGIATTKDIAAIKEAFSFELCDQTNYVQILEK